MHKVASRARELLETNAVAEELRISETLYCTCRRRGKNWITESIPTNCVADVEERTNPDYENEKKNRVRSGTENRSALTVVCYLLLRLDACLLSRLSFFTQQQNQISL